MMLVVRDNDGRKLDHATLEVMRVRAVEAVESGQHPEDVAAAYGLHRKTVYGWIARYSKYARLAHQGRPKAQVTRVALRDRGGGYFGEAPV